MNLDEVLDFGDRRPPLVIGLNSPSGAGKTVSAQRLALGFCGGDAQKIMVVCAEQGRAKPSALQHGIRCGVLDPPYSPERYIAVIRGVERMGMDVLILDGVSPEWEGEGGVTDNPTGRKIRFSDWGGPKGRHKEFMRALLGAKIPLTICTLRTKQKMQQVKGGGQNGKDAVIDLGQQPIQEKDFPYEMAVQIMFTRDGHYDPRAQPPEYKVPGHLRHVFDGSQITEETGRLLREASEAIYSMGQADAASGFRELYEVARRAALEGGINGYRSFHSGLSGDQKRALMPKHEELKRIANDADAALEERDGDELGWIHGGVESEDRE